MLWRDARAAPVDNARKEGVGRQPAGGDYRSDMFTRLGQADQGLLVRKAAILTSVIVRDAPRIAYGVD